MVDRRTIYKKPAVKCFWMALRRNIWNENHLLKIIQDSENLCDIPQSNIKYGHSEAQLLNPGNDIYNSNKTIMDNTRK